MHTYSQGCCYNSTYDFAWTKAIAYVCLITFQRMYTCCLVLSYVGNWKKNKARSSLRKRYINRQELHIFRGERPTQNHTQNYIQSHYTRWKASVSPSLLPKKKKKNAQIKCQFFLILLFFFFFLRSFFVIAGGEWFRCGKAWIPEPNM